MPFILGLIGLATAAYFMVIRARRGAEMASELMDVASDVRAAARRFGFRRKQNIHPVDSIDDPKLALGALSAAFMALDDLPTQDGRTALDAQLRKHLELDSQQAQEIAVLGQWFVETCGGADAAVKRLSKRLYALDKGQSFGVLMAVIQGTIHSTGHPLSTRQSEALVDIKRAFHLS
ncbi:hypothetical protein [Ascidiaceihabitans sp.]|uniref:hypothetical protein n=1 Tax=Ascidiaceihabitans sp. TaxID=1872644 RepID=UPI003297E787